MKTDLPELDSLYYTICLWNFYSDLSKEQLTFVYKEEDRDSELDNGLVYDLEKIPLKFNSSDEYIKTFYDRFLHETKAQITRSKVGEVNKYILSYFI